MAGRRVLYVFALAALLAGALWTSTAGAQGFRSGVVKLWDPRGIAYDAQLYRVLHDVSKGGNVAVFRYRLPNGELRTLAIESKPFSKGGGKNAGEGHSEERLDLILERWGIDPDWVLDIYSELEPCALPGHNCSGMIKKTFRNLQSVNWSYDYPYDPNAGDADKANNRNIRRASMKALKAEVTDLMNRNVIPGGRTRLPVLSPHFMPKFPGGIDFTSLELRYVADNGRGGIRYSLRGNPSAAPSDPNVAIATAGQASDAFFTWMSLPPQSFWVNLNPAEPNRIIDPTLARSDAGRVLLEADLLLKKTTVRLLNPDTPIGDQFWDELEALYGERAPEACIGFRVWIVPEPATVRESSGELYILDAPLTAKAEGVRVTYPGHPELTCPHESDAFEDKKDEILRRVIMPPVIQAVRTRPEYAELRRVYFSRVAAEWFRARSATRQTALSQFVNSGNIDRWVSRTPWDPIDVFNRYLTSIRDGEWHATRHIKVGDREYERAMVMGGVDFSQTPERPVTKREFKARWPRLAKRVHESQHAAQAGESEVWLGGGDPRSAALKRVRLTLRARTRRVAAGDRVTYRLGVANPIGRPLRDVDVCNRLPSQLAFVRSSARQRLRNGWRCWEIARIGAGRTKTIRITARALRGARGRARVRAIATLPDSSQAALAARAFRIRQG